LQATQEDLRCMLLQAGGVVPHVIAEPPEPLLPSASSGEAGGGGGLPPSGGVDEDDPFAQPPSHVAAAAPAAPADATSPAQGVAAGAPTRLANEPAPPSSSALAHEIVEAAGRWGVDEQQLLREYSVALLQAFAEVFDAELVAAH
jgi:hypothetical protein